MTDYITTKERLNMFDADYYTTKMDRLTFKFAKWTCIASVLYICAQVVRIA